MSNCHLLLTFCHMIILQSGVLLWYDLRRVFRRFPAWLYAAVSVYHLHTLRRCMALCARPAMIPDGIGGKDQGIPAGHYNERARGCLTASAPAKIKRTCPNRTVDCRIVTTMEAKKEPSR